MSYNSDQTPSGSFRPSTISEYVKHGKPIALITPIPEEDVLHITSKAVHPLSLRSRGSLSTGSLMRGSSELELKPRSSVEDSRYFDQQPQNHAFTRKSSFIRYFHKLGSLDSKFASKSLSNLKEQFSDSLLEGASKHRVAGRGGSGSQLRKKSSSNSAVSSPNVPHPPSSSPTALESNISRRPLEFSFWHWATGRGGAGSPIPILGFLHGRKQSESQLTEQRKSQQGPPPIDARCSSLNVNYQIPNNAFAVSNHSGSSRTMSDEIFPSLAPVSSTLEQLSPLISPSPDPDDNDDTDSYIEDAIRPTPDERRQRSLNKLIKTFGVREPGDIQQLPQKVSKGLFKRASMLLIGDKFKAPRSPRLSLESRTHTCDLHQLDLADDLDNVSNFEGVTHSPITFSSLPLDKSTPHPEQIPSPLSDVNCSMAISPTGESNSTFLHSLTEPSLLFSPATLTDHSTSHSISVHNDIPSPNPNDLPVKSNWLVPLGTHNDEVISIRKTKPQSWIGEWNGDMQDVIESLRLL